MNYVELHCEQLLVGHKAPWISIEFQGGADPELDFGGTSLSFHAKRFLALLLAIVDFAVLEAITSSAPRGLTLFLSKYAATCLARNLL